MFSAPFSFTIKVGRGLGGLGGQGIITCNRAQWRARGFFYRGGWGGVGWSYLPQKSSTVLSEPKFGTPTKKSLGLPLVRGQNVLNNNFLTTVREQYVCMYVPVHSLHVTCFRCLLTTILLTYFCSNYPDPVYIKI